MRVAAALTTLVIFATPALASCPDIEPFADGIGGTAAQYASKGKLSLREDGVLVFDYGGAYGGLGEWPNPFFVSRYANGLYADWYRNGCKDDDLERKFLRQAEWFAENHENRDGMAVWAYSFRNHHYDLAPGWISGIGQSHIAAVLYRAYSMTGDEQYRDLSLRAMEPYFRPMSEGGVVVHGDGGTWVQEAPTPDGIAYNVLNGHITGILGILDMARMTEAERYDQLVRDGIDAVRAQIRNFDAGFTSFYALRSPGSDPVKLAPLDGYHNLHIRQLERLHEIDGDPIFLEMAERFRVYQQANYERSALGSNLDTHAANDADGRVRSTYWSHNQFPTWYQVTMEAGTSIEGVFIKGQNPPSTPRDFTVSVLSEGEWSDVWSSPNNSEQSLYLEFPYPVSGDALRLDIRSDNGGNNVALDTVMPVVAYDGPKGGPVSAAELATLEPGFRRR